LVTRTLKTLLPAALAVAALAVAAGPAAAATPCWTTLVNDWYDGRIDRVYEVKCYREALKHLPTDVETYSSAREDIDRALAAVIAGGKGPGDSGRKPGGGPVGGALDDIGPKDADSVPIPLIVLAGIAVLLLALGSAGLVTRRLQARRIPVQPAGGAPPVPKP